MTLITPIPGRTDLGLATFNLYRDIHKGIRSELFAVTEEAGRLDPSDRTDRAALAEHLRSVVWLLTTHADHEDAAIQPVLEEQLPSLAERIATDHETLDRRLHGLQGFADATVDTGGVARSELDGLYFELASFTSAYLEHQDVEERVVMPALEAAIGVEASVGVHQAIVGAIPPADMARSLAVMLPAMNVEDRTEMLGAMQAEAPPEAFQGVWSLAGSVLCPADHAALARRLGLA